MKGLSQFGLIAETHIMVVVRIPAAHMVGGRKMVALIEAVRQGSIYLAWQLSLVRTS